MTDLRALVAEELSMPVDPRVGAMAAAIAAKHGTACRAVLFYGSCLRERELDGRMLDFYLIVSDYRAAYGKRWLAAANRLIPPNVFYFEKDGLAAKYAVLSEADFSGTTARRPATCRSAARFAQPSRLVWAADAAARNRAIDSGEPRRADVACGWPGRWPGEEPLELWRRAFALTYSAELRAERKGRAAVGRRCGPRALPAVCRCGAAQVGAIDPRLGQRGLVAAQAAKGKR